MFVFVCFYLNTSCVCVLAGNSSPHGTRCRLRSYFAQVPVATFGSRLTYIYMCTDVYICAPTQKIHLLTFR